MLRRAWRLSVLGGLALAIVGPAAWGQAVTTIGATPSCPRCTIEVVRVARIGGPNDSLFFAVDGLTLARDSRGRYYLGPREQHGDVPVTVYDSVGRYLSVIGRAGEGPGEVPRLQSFLLGQGDTLVMFDYRKIVVYSPQHRFVREYPSIQPVHRGLAPVLMPNGNVVIPALLGSPDRAGYPLHLLSKDGEILRSFGVEVPVVRPDRTWDLRRYIAPAGGSLIWSAHVNRYRIEQWDVSGRLLRVLERDTPLFRPWQAVNPEDGYASPMLSAVHQSRDGLLWTRVVLPRPNVAYDPSVDVYANLNARYDTVVEVIDPTEGRLIASRRSPGVVLRGFWSGNLMTSYSSGSDGTPYIDIWQINLKRP